ncbi:MAG: hypothetical protein O7G84_07475 [Gammaproteobacteria bacterium]|nr:hypothetical protein [Gammaproteobacteria bacterium]
MSVSPNNGYFVAHGKLQKYRMRETAIEELGLDGRASTRLIHDPANAPAPSLGRCVGLSAPADSYGYVLVQKGQNEEILMNFWY